MKIKINKVVLFVVIGITLVLSVVIVATLFKPKPIESWNYHGQIVAFRDDLREADKVPIYPGADEVFLDTIHPLVKNVTIAFKDAGEEENSYYVVEVIEITLKMTLAYRRMLGGYPGLSEEDMPKFNATPVEEYANLPGKIQNPIIALVHPKYANETAVRNEGHVTYISGKTYRDFDLATIKFLMTVLDIDLTELENQ